MHEFIYTEFFRSAALLTRYITTHKIPKRKILSIIHDGEKYALFYYTTIKKEDKYMKQKRKKALNNGSRL